jgi:O-antigen ligase
LNTARVRHVTLARWKPDSVMVDAWPILICTAALPLMFLLGLQGLAWAAPGIVLSLRLVRQPRTRIPTGVALLGVAVMWMLLGVLQVRIGGFPLFFYRWSLFLGAFASELYLINTPTSRVPTARISQWLAALWIAMIAFGWLAILFPLDTKSPFLLVMPGPISNIEFLDSISAWRMAEVQGFLGFPLPRPAAPFPAANGWGSAAGLLFPLFLKHWLVEARGRRKTLGVWILVMATAPIIYSFNRGLWLSIGLCLVYLVIRHLLSGRWQALLVVAAGAAVIAAVVLLTPLGDLATEKVETAGDSNDSRNELVQGAIEGAKESPLLGHGAPERVREDLPPLGTHGMVWYLVFVHGFVVTALYLGWLGIEIVRSAPSRSPGSIWFHLVLVVAGLQTFVYGMLPQVVIIGIVAGLARREAMGRARHITAGGTADRPASVPAMTGGR